jgi:hypothetical protein
MSLRVLVPQTDLLDFDERDHDLLGGVPALHLQMEIVRGDAADPLSDILPTG